MGLFAFLHGARGKVLPGRKDSKRETLFEYTSLGHFESKNKILSINAVKLYSNSFRHAPPIMKKKAMLKLENGVPLSLPVQTINYFVRAILCTMQLFF